MLELDAEQIVPDDGRAMNGYDHFVHVCPKRYFLMGKTDLTPNSLPKISLKKEGSDYMQLFNIDDEGIMIFDTMAKAELAAFKWNKRAKRRAFERFMGLETTVYSLAKKVNNPPSPIVISKQGNPFTVGEVIIGLVASAAIGAAIVVGIMSSI